MLSTACRPRVLATLGATFLAILATAGSALAAGNAGYTTYDTTVQGCTHGSGINCNIYSSKDAVYMGGGPSGGNGLDDGQYFFAVLEPGAQNTFLSGAGLLSTDSVAERTFTEKDGVIHAYDGTTHAVGTGVVGQKVIGLAEFGDSPNGVYILAVCEVGADSPSDCKFDAFKVRTTPLPPGQAEQLIVTKTAAATFTRTYPWGIAKTVDATEKSGLFGSVSVNYGVMVTKGVAVDSNYRVSGAITVTNPNPAAVANVTVEDLLGDATGECTVTDGANVSVGVGDTVFAYSCSFTGTPTDFGLEGLNTARVSYPQQTLSNGTTIEAGEPTGTAPYAFDNGELGNPTVVDDCTTVTDPNASAGTFPPTTCASTTYPYPKSLPVPSSGCVDYPNTATSTTADLGIVKTASQSVRVCRVPPVTGGHTIGFWQNRNGQALIKNGPSTGGVCNAGTWLRNLGPTGTGPFDDLSATATCAQVATYVTGVINAATCGGVSCNAMLKAQMLATALSVRLFDPPLGNLLIDLDVVPSGGGFIDVGAAFDGASKLTVQQMLDYAATRSTAIGGTTWYGQSKATQMLAKDAFDAINNRIAFQAAP